MLVQSFIPFARLPVEIQYMIWGAAIWPRMVHLVGRWHEDIRKDTAFKATPCDYLYSPCPIPPLLQVSRDSREAMKQHGYTLAFSTRRSHPRTWFNFQHDVLYLFDLYRTNHPTHCQDSVSYIALSSPADLGKVRKVALQSTISLPRLSPHPLNPPISMPIFGQLDELLIVEQHFGDGLLNERNGLSSKHTQDNLWGYVECDIADVLGKSRLYQAELGWRYCYEVKEHIQATKTYGRGFFDGLAKKFESELRRDRHVILGDGSEKADVPKVRIVTVASKSAAQHLLKLREQYWRNIEEIEEREAEQGIPPLSPFSAQWEDAIEEAYGYRA